ncbi:alpha/beta fold hydrolase, partial [Oleiphilus sp. HI0079]|uniref:alpha/beta fold hydrolase n=1 Tax=Oleiphilus sp. HI0079 TaxID=1822254 RepID=UPI003516F8D3
MIHFLHGNGFNGLVYEKFLGPLSKHFDLFLSNAQGHGDSDAGERFTNWDDSAHYFSEVWQHYSSMWNDVPRVGLG